MEFVSPGSMQETSALCEPSVAELEPGQTCQFERIGYFCLDSKLSKPGAPVVNQTVGLRDTRAAKART